MASQAASRRASTLDLLRTGPPAQWIVLLALAAPWLRFELGLWTLYPGHVALTLLLAASLLEEGAWGEALRPLAPLLLLGTYVAALSALRGEWPAAVSVGLATVGNLVWGAAAMRLGMQGRTPTDARAALLGMLGLTLLVGAVAWLFQAVWPSGCRVLSCQEGAPWPYPFTGGWGSAAQYALIVLLLLPLLSASLVDALRGRLGPDARRTLPVLTGATALSLVAGAPLWALLLAILGWELLRRSLGTGLREPQRLLLRGLAAGGVFTVVLVYGLEPGYLHRLWGNADALPAVRVTMPEPPPRRLSSEAAVPLSLVLRNTGWSPLGGEPGRELGLRLLYLVTPERGTSRTVPGPLVQAGGRLLPGDAREVPLLLRVPPWLRDGYLTWEPELGDGRPVPLARGSLPGFRFSNEAYRRLGLDPENQLSSLAQRAREFQEQARPVAGAVPDANSPVMVLGDVLDTLFFSPLWGEPEPGHPGAAFSPGRPWLPSLLHQYGLIGLALVVWLFLRLQNRAFACGDPSDLSWRLLPLVILLLAAAGFFTPVLASLHSHWAVFVLAGFLEGRYAQRHPWPRIRLSTPRPWRLRIRLPSLAMPRIRLPGWPFSRRGRGRRRW